MFIVTSANVIINAFDTVWLTLKFPPSAKIDQSKLDFGYFDNTDDKDDYKKLNVHYWRNKGNWQFVTVRFTFGQLLYKSNVFAADSQTEIDRALDIISIKVSALLNIKFDAFCARVIAVDPFRDVSELEKQSYFQILERHDISRLSRCNYRRYSYFSGFTFTNKSRRIRIYDKFAQLNAKHPDQPQFVRDFAKNIIRFEVHLTGYSLRKAIMGKFGSDNEDFTARKILTLEFAEYVINTNLDELELNQNIPTVADHEKLILKHFPRAKTANQLIRFITDIKTNGTAQLKRSDKNKFDYRKRQLKQVGIWKTLFANHRLQSFNDFGSDDESMY